MRLLRDAGGVPPRLLVDVITALLDESQGEGVAIVFSR